jgi:rhomboid protease GluP
MENGSREATASYLAKRMCGDRGFTLGAVDEAKPLADASDIVLTRSDGMSFQIICIVDRQADPARRFGLDVGAVVQAGKACLGYTGKVQRTKIPVAIEIWEVGRGAPTSDDLQRLTSLKRSLPGRDRVVISSWSVDAVAAKVWSSAPFGGLLAGRRYLERVMREPRKIDGEIFREPAAVSASSGKPWVTCALLAVLALAFLAELLLGVRPFSGALQPDILTLVATGGLALPLVQEGQWYRLLTGAFLHGDVFHLAVNGVALFMAGLVLENLFGRAWLLALFVVGALGGSALSLALNPSNSVSVGASGAIMCLLAAAFASSFRFPYGADRTQIQMRLMQMLIPSLIPLATHRAGGRIDFAAHLGGTVVGAAAGLLLMRTWPRSEPLPRFRRLAGAIALAGLAVLAVGVVSLKSAYPQWGALPSP